MLSQPHGHGAAGRVKSMKNPSEPLGKRNRDLVACSTVPQILIGNPEQKRSVERPKRKFKDNININFKEVY
jgi:hypothetical protein